MARFRTAATTGAGGEFKKSLIEETKEGLRDIGEHISGLAATVTGAAVKASQAAVDQFRSSVQAASAALKDMAVRMAKVGGGMAAGGAAIVAPMAAAAVDFAKYGKDISKIADDYSLGTEAASVFSLASKETGESIKDLTKKMPEGSEAFATWRKEAERMGLVLGGEAVASAEALGLSYQRLKDATRGFTTQLGSAVAPIVRESTELMVAAIKIATQWVQEHKPLIATAFKVASAVATIGAGLVTLAGGLGTAAALLTPLNVALAGVAGGLAIVEYKTGAARSMWAAYGDSVRAVYSTVRGYLTQIWAFTSETMDGVTNAIRGGRLDLAVTIAWSAAKVAWVASLQEIDHLTSGTFGAIFQSLAAGNWNDSVTALWNTIKIAWYSGLQSLDEIWGNIQTTFDGVWSNVVSKADGYFARLVNAFDAAGVQIANTADVWWSAITETWNKIEARGRTLLAFFSGLATGAQLVWEAMGLAAKMAFGPIMTQIDLMVMALEKTVNAFLAVGGAVAKIAAGNLSKELAATRLALQVGVGTAKQTGSPLAGIAGRALGALDATTAESEKKPEAAGGKGVKTFAQLRAEQRERDLAARQAGRIAASDDRAGERQEAADNAAFARQSEAHDRQIAWENEIFSLEQQNAKLAGKAGMEADRLRYENNLKLQAALVEAKKAKEDADFKKPKLGEVPSEMKTRQPIGTSSAYALQQQFGTGRDDQFLEQGKKQTMTLAEMLSWQKMLVELTRNRLAIYAAGNA